MRPVRNPLDLFMGRFNTKQYAGRNWKEQIVDDAIEWLEEIMS